MGFSEWLFGEAPSTTIINAQDKIARENTFDPNESAMRQSLYNKAYGNGGLYGSYQNLLSGLLPQYQNIQQGYNQLAQGNIPSAYSENFQKGIQSDVDRTVGSTLNNLGRRGVVNSSVSADAFGNIGKGVAEQSAKNFQSNIGLLSGLLGNQAGMLNQQQGNVMQQAGLQGQGFEHQRSLYEPSVNRRFALQNDYIQNPGSQGALSGILGAVGTAMLPGIGGALGNMAGNWLSGSGKKTTNTNSGLGTFTDNFGNKY